mgnify:CR=1 FL=1
MMDLIYGLVILIQVAGVDYGTTELCHWVRRRSKVGRDVIHDRV